MKSAFFINILLRRLCKSTVAYIWKIWYIFLDYKFPNKFCDFNGISLRNKIHEWGIKREIDCKSYIQYLFFFLFSHTEWCSGSLLAVSRDYMGFQGPTPGCLYASQTPCLLYYCSGLMASIFIVVKIHNINFTTLTIYSLVVTHKENGGRLEIYLNIFLSFYSVLYMI